MNDSLVGDRAVVLGASIAGLVATRALADLFAEVVVVERDELGVTGSPRRGVPQGRHIHGLMARGQEVLEEFFPGLTDDLVEEGVPLIDQAGQVRLYLSGCRLKPSPSDIRVLSASRPGLEAYVRRRVQALPDVAWRDGRDIVGLVTTPEGDRVTGARVIRRADGSSEELLEADLVVDATGRGSRTPIWLEALGRGSPAEETIPIGVGYASAIFRLAPGALGRDLAVIQAPTPARPRGGGLTTLEGGRCIVTLMGVLGDHPPADLPGFMDFARSLEHPDIFDALQGAEPTDLPVSLRFPASVRRRYERMRSLPDGLLVTGDALCSFNPIYGQGMTVAALEAQAMHRSLIALAPARPGLRKEVLRTSGVMDEIARVVDVPWDMAAGGDLAYPGVTGSRTVKIRVGNAYLPRLHAAAQSDARLTVAFLRVAGLLDPPQALFRPDLVMRVLRQSGAGRRRAATADTAGSSDESRR
ncbi:hypothetical protein LL946_02825 [Knoellia locipacati]|uniref:FAD-dependent oxidoreductase n=1 Tax=Knoellia locipacati TaxID=882824 RepID=UPI00384DCA6C